MIVASGFSGHGFGIAPAISGIISDLVLNKKPRLPINSFTLHRFQNQNILNSDKYDLTLHGWYKMISYVCVKVTEKLVLNK